MMGHHRLFLARLCAVLIVGIGACAAETPVPDEFSWRAPLQLPAGAALARAQIPPQALQRLQSSDSRDLRIFNAAGQAVPFALMDAPRGQPAAERPRTAVYAALPLYSAAGTAGQAKGATEVRIGGAGGQRSVWVRLDGTEVPAGNRLNAALFATKNETRAFGAIEVHGSIPANTPVHMSLSSSADLSQWVPVPLQGRLYRFEGTGAPANMTLELERPFKPEGQFIRLDWSGQDGVAVTGLAGLLAMAGPGPVRERVDLPAPRAVGSGAVEIETGFATPLAALAIRTSAANALYPVRILGRSEPSHPWRLLGQTVVYRLANAGADATNSPLPLSDVSARWLRIESTAGADLGTAQLQASAELRPLRVVFVATGPAPFELAVGRAATAAAALPLATIGSTLGAARIDDLPQATVEPALAREAPKTGLLARLWPGSGVPARTTVLWAVLLGGVLILAMVAWSLVRQLKAANSTEP